jgi:thiol-disulfide isomerase/thioredoxin
MRYCPVVLAAVFGLFGLVPAALGQEEGARPDPVAIMRQADEALAKVQSLSFTASLRGVGGKATRTPAVDAAVQISRQAKDPLGWKFAVEGTAVKAGGEAQPLHTTYDGKVVRSVRARDKQVIEAAASNSTEPMQDGAGWVLTWLLRWPDMVHRGFSDPEMTFSARYEGKMDIGGEMCDVVYVDYSEMSDPTLFDAWWYIAERDSLPRRVEMHFIENAAGDGFTVVTLSELSTSGTVDPGAFVLATPEGFEVVQPKEPPKLVGRQAGARAGIPVGDIAPDWTLKDLDGNEHTLSNYRGKIVIMDFWATWCGPCVLAMPGVQALHEKYKDSGVVVFGMNCWESGDPAAFMKEKGFTYTTLLNADPVAQAYMVSGIPMFYIIGPDGRVMNSFVGYDANMEERIGALIEASVRP